MIRIPFAGGHYEGRSKHINAQECFNYYPEVSDQETKGETTLHATPGLDIVNSADLGSGPIRGMIMHETSLFVVSGNTLYRFAPDETSGRVDSSVTPTNEGTLNTSVGPMSLASSGAQGSQLLMTDGNTLYAWEEESSGTVSAATEASPSVWTTVGHGLQTGNKVTASDFAGGTWGDPPNDNEYSITRIDDDTFSIDGFDSSSLGTYTGDSGKWVKTKLITVGRLLDTGSDDDGTETFQGASAALGDWASPDNILTTAAADTLYDFGDSATITNTENLLLTDFGFGLATTDTVVGLRATITDYDLTNDDGGRYRITVAPVKAGVARFDYGYPTIDFVTTTTSTKTLGSTTSLPGALTLTATEVNAANFGVAVKAWVTDASLTGEINIDHLAITVYYTGGSVPNSEFVVWVDNNFLASSGGTGQFYQTTQGLNWDQTSFATAERNPDNLRAIATNHREVWLLGDTSTEVWYNSGDDFPFDPIPNAFSEWGIMAPFSVARAGQNLLWLSRNAEGGNQVVMTTGYQVAPVSTPQVDWIINQYGTTNDATAYTMQISGHLWYVLSFPTAKATWVYDLTTKAWFRWDSGGSKTPSGEGMSQPPSRHRGHVHAFDGRTHFLGDWENGNLYKVNANTFEDNSNPIYRVRTSQRIHGGMLEPTAARNKIFYHAVEVEVNAGADVLGDFSTASEERARVGLSWSDDNGYTFTDTIWRYVEQTGKEALRLRWQQLGSSRERIFRLETDTNRDIVIVDANIEATLGGN